MRCLAIGLVSALALSQAAAEAAPPGQPTPPHKGPPPGHRDFITGPPGPMPQKRVIDESKNPKTAQEHGHAPDPAGHAILQPLPAPPPPRKPGR
jgi:hypothetical protein